MAQFKCKGCGAIVEITPMLPIDAEFCQLCLAVEFNSAVDDLMLSQEDTVNLI